MTIPAQTGVPVQLVKMIKRIVTVHQDLMEIIVRMESILIVPTPSDFGNDTIEILDHVIL